MTDYAQQAYWTAFAVTPDTLNLAAGFYPWSNPVWTVQDLPNNEKEVKACLETILEKAKEVQRPPRIICESAWIFHRLLERHVRQQRREAAQAERDGPRAHPALRLRQFPGGHAL